MANLLKQCSNLSDSTFKKFIKHYERSYILKSVFVIQKILRLFVNTLTADEKHYLLNRDNLGQLIQRQLSQKQKTFAEFFFFCIFKIYIKS